MILLISLLGGFVVGFLVLHAVLPSLQRPPFLVENFRRVQIPTAAGIVILVSLVAVEAVANLFGSWLNYPAWLVRPAAPIAIGVVGTFSAFGLLDDLAAAPGDRGFKGHLRALGQLRITTGALKLFAGAGVCLALIHGANLGWTIINAAIIALSANFTNQLDMRPGRTLKVAIVWAVVMFALSSLNDVLAPVAVVFGASMALFLPDLRGRLMLGDTGANAIGAALGLGLVGVADDQVRLGFLCALVLLTLVGDTIGFTRIIQVIPPLRYLDELGRTKVLDTPQQSQYAASPHPRSDENGEEAGLRSSTQAPDAATSDAPGTPPNTDWTWPPDAPEAGPSDPSGPPPVI